MNPNMFGRAVLVIFRAFIVAVLALLPLGDARRRRCIDWFERRKKLETVDAAETEKRVSAIDARIDKLERQRRRRRVKIQQHSRRVNRGSTRRGLAQ